MCICVGWLVGWLRLKPSALRIVNDFLAKRKKSISHTKVRICKCMSVRIHIFYAMRVCDVMPRRVDFVKIWMFPCCFEQFFYCRDSLLHKVIVVNIIGKHTVHRPHFFRLLFMLSLPMLYVVCNVLSKKHYPQKFRYSFSLCQSKCVASHRLTLLETKNSNSCSKQLNASKMNHEMPFDINKLELVNILVFWWLNFQWNGS